MQKLLVELENIIKNSSSNDAPLAAAIALYKKNNPIISPKAKAILQKLNDVLLTNSLNNKEQTIIIELLLSMSNFIYTPQNSKDPYHHIKEILIKHNLYSVSNKENTFKLDKLKSRYLIDKEFELYLRATLLILRKNAKSIIPQEIVVKLFDPKLSKYKNFVEVPVNIWHPHSEKDNGKTIVFLHGLTHKKEHSKPMAEELCQLGFKIVSYDQVGHGLRKEGNKEINKDRLTHELQLICSYLDDKEDREIIVIGHSIGGTIALQATHKIKQVKHTVAICPAMEPYTSIWSYVFNPKFIRRLFKEMAYKESKDYIAQKGHSINVHRMEFLLNNLSGIFKDAYDATIKSKLTKAHIILSSRDKVVSNHTKGLAKSKNIKLDIIDSDHLPTISIPSTLASLICQQLPHNNQALA